MSTLLTISVDVVMFVPIKLLYVPDVMTAFEILLFVEAMFVPLMAVEANKPVEILVVAKIVPVVNPVLKLRVPELNAVCTAFVTVVFVPIKVVELMLVPIKFVYVPDEIIRFEILLNEDTMFVAVILVEFN
jgi:hypothetical protein